MTGKRKVIIIWVWSLFEGYKKIMYLYLPLYPNSIIAIGTAPSLGLPWGHKSEGVRFRRVWEPTMDWALW